MMGRSDDAPLQTRHAPAGSLNELIYFGRHEKRKGFELFVDAVAQLPPALQVPVTFIGRFHRIDGEFTGSLALRKLADYAGSLRFFNDMGQGTSARLYSPSRASALRHAIADREQSVRSRRMLYAGYPFPCDRCWGRCRID
jgi:hypothetical protein